MSDKYFLALLSILIFLGPFASDSYLPSMPAMGHAFQASPNQIQLTLTFYFLGFSLPQLLYGPASDRFGRRKMLILGYSLALAGSIICILSPTIHWLWFGRFVQGLGVAANGALFRTILRDKFHGVRLAEIGSYLGMLFAFFPAIAPFIGGIIQQSWGWEANFYLFIALSLIILGVAVFLFPETAKKLNPDALEPKVFIANYKTLLKNASFMGYALATACAFSGLISYYMVSPYFFQEVLGLTPFQYGLTSFIVTLGLLSGHYLNTKLVSKRGIENMIKAGFWFMLLGGIALLITEFLMPLNLSLILLSTLLFLIGAGLVFGNSTAGAFHPFPHIAGSAGALFGTLQVLGTAITSYLVALASENTYILGITFTLLALVAFAGNALLIEKRQ